MLLTQFGSDVVVAKFFVLTQSLVTSSNSYFYYILEAAFLFFPDKTQGASESLVARDVLDHGLGSCLICDTCLASVCLRVLHGACVCDCGVCEPCGNLETRKEQFHYPPVGNKGHGTREQAVCVCVPACIYICVCQYPCSVCACIHLHTGACAPLRG